MRSGLLVSTFRVTRAMPQSSWIFWFSGFEVEILRFGVESLGLGV